MQGTLDSFRLADVLQLLSATAKTGCLRIEGDGGRGTVWLQDGAVTSATADRVPGDALDEVVCDLLRFEQGSFAFSTDERAPDALGDGYDLGDLLDRAGELLSERRGLEAVVPSLDHEVGLTERLAGDGHVTVTAEQWTALVAVGAGCTVGDLASTLGLTELSALRTVHDLVTSGLTTVRPSRTSSGLPSRREQSRPARSAPPDRPRADHHARPDHGRRDHARADRSRPDPAVLDPAVPDRAWSDPWSDPQWSDSERSDHQGSDPQRSDYQRSDNGAMPDEPQPERRRSVNGRWPDPPPHIPS
jgi:hypothetical protein